MSCFFSVPLQLLSVAVLERAPLALLWCGVHPFVVQFDQLFALEDLLALVAGHVPILVVPLMCA